ncbi:MAG: hypothetical protein ACI841_002594 [Planctomycetota bacterium]|jgi:hypothetical protein
MLALSRNMTLRSPRGYSLILACGFSFLLVLLVPAGGANQEEDVSLLTIRALRGDPDVPADVFEQIAAAKTRLALNSLITCCERGRVDLRPAAFLALRHFFGVEKLEQTAVDFLTQHALSDDSRAATRALVRFASVAQDQLEEVLLKSEDERTQQLAVGGLVDVLAKRDTEESLELLLDHYRPPLSGSPERGALALGSFQSEDSTQTLLKKVARSKTPASVRAMIFSALALREGVKVSKALEKGLRDKDPIAVVATIDAMRMRRESGHTSKLESLLRSKAPSIRCAAMHSLTLLRYPSPDFKKQLDKALDGKDFALRLGVARAFGSKRDSDSARLLSSMIDDEHSTVRRDAIDRSLARRIGESIPHLIARMEQDGVRLRERAHAALLELSGVDHGLQAERWKAWWKAEGANFQMPDAASVRETLRARNERREAAPTHAESTFYGVRFATDRVIFVLDISGSMQEFGRLPRMKREVLAALDEIPDGASFNLIYFGSSVYPLGKGMVLMSPNNRKAVRRSILSQQDLGGTNLHGGLRAAFADPNVETIVLLSDGEPTEGVTGFNSILRDVRRWNDLRGVVVHTVAIGWDGSLLQAISATTGGEASSAF